MLKYDFFEVFGVTTRVWVTKNKRLLSGYKVQFTLLTIVVVNVFFEKIYVVCSILFSQTLRNNKKGWKHFGNDNQNSYKPAEKYSNTVDILQQFLVEVLKNPSDTVKKRFDVLNFIEKIFQ